MLKQRTVLRIAGLVAVVASLYVVSTGQAGTEALAATLTGIVALVAPDVLDRLPWVAYEKR